MSVQEWSRLKGIIDLYRYKAIDKDTFCLMWKDATEPQRIADDQERWDAIS